MGRSPSRSIWVGTLLASLSLTLLASWPASRLRIVSDLLDLLPVDHPAAQDYRFFLDAFGGLEQIYVLVGTDDAGPDAAERVAEAAWRLTELLSESELIADARAGPTSEDEEFVLRYVLPRAALLADDDRTDRLLQRLDPSTFRERVRWLKAELASPAGVGLAPLLAADPLGLSEELRIASTLAGGAPVDPLLGAFLGRSGRTALVIATPRATELDTRVGRMLLERLERSFATIREESGEDLVFEAIGGPLYAARDEAWIRRDVERTVLGSALGIGSLLLLYFGRPGIALVLLVSVVAGILWTAAAMSLVHGSVSVIGISFAAILLGLGIDYGVHGAHHYRQARIEGGEAAAAMLLSFRRTGRAILVSVATTFAVFLVLGLAYSRPIRELGFLVAFGIVAILVASLTLGAPLLVLSARRAPVDAARPGRLWRLVDAAVDGVVDLARRHRRRVLAGALLLTLASIPGILRLRFDADPRGLRPADDPSRAAEERLADEFAVGLDSFDIVVAGANLGEALQAAERVERLLADTLPERLAVQSPSDFVVAGTLLEQRRLRFRGRVDPASVDRLRTELASQGFDPARFSLAPLEGVVRGTAIDEVPFESWPDWLSHGVRRSDDRVLVSVRATARVGVWSEGPPADVLARLVQEVPSARIASFPRVVYELRRLLGGELLRLGGWCLLVVVALVALSFRGNPRRTLYAFVPVGLGCVWLLGLCGAAGIPIGLLSVVAAPLLLGIGIDDGLHALHGEATYGGLASAVRQVGSAMTLTSATTCLGFGSLMLSRIPAVENGGLVVSLGVALCLLASLVLLPALGAGSRS